jgi:hypothetical protein
MSIDPTFAAVELAADAAADAVLAEDDAARDFLLAGIDLSSLGTTGFCRTCLRPCAALEPPSSCCA